MQHSKRETFHELLRRLATLSPDFQDAAMDGLNLMGDQVRPIATSVNHDELDRKQVDSTPTDRNVEVLTEETTSFESQSPSISHAASSLAIDYPGDLEFWSVVQAEPQQQLFADLAQRVRNRPGSRVDRPDDALATEVGAASRMDIYATSTDQSVLTLTTRVPDESRETSTLRPNKVVAHTQPPNENSFDHAVARPLPVIQPGDSQLDDYEQSKPAGGHTFDSDLREASNTQQAIDDLTSRVAQLETAQLIRGRL